LRQSRTTDIYLVVLHLLRPIYPSFGLDASPTNTTVLKSIDFGNSSTLTEIDTCRGY
jgi:hypothetical protein